MKTSFSTKAAAALALMVVSSASMAAIQITKHNLGNTRTGNTHPNFTNATTEICVFCHTPHGADTEAQAPLWNRKLDTATVYKTYSSLGTSTLDAATAPVGSVSLACLSCHDGTQAMNVVINSPGSGTVGDVSMTLDANDNVVLKTGLNTGNAGTPCAGITCAGFGEFNAMSQVSSEMIYLSTDLRNDHPISIQYAGAAAGTGTDPDFHAAASATVNGQTVWYVEAANTVSYTQADASTVAGTASALDKTDLKLYTRGAGSTGFNGGGGSYVECATCHDPHVEATTFLRMGNNNGSQVCLTCHSK